MHAAHSSTGQDLTSPSHIPACSREAYPVDAGVSRLVVHPEHASVRTGMSGQATKPYTPGDQGTQTLHNA